MRKLICILATLTLICKSNAQSNTAEIYQNINALNVFARVLFITMEPGDEDAQLIAYLSKQAHCDVGLLCLTRGEKMTNYAGYEKGVDLGIIHAQELAKAGAAAGFTPMASCAMDLGNYGSAKDVFSVWNEDALMSNLVWAIRSFRPDVIITPYNSGKDSGCDLLTTWIIEANKRAGNKDYNSIQLAGLYHFLDTFSAKQIYWDVPDAAQEDDKTSIPVLTNQLDEASGSTYKEIAKQSYLCERSVFKDLNNLPLRKDTQYLKPLLSSSKSLFENIDTSWSRVGTNFQNDVNAILLRYDFLHPEKSLSNLTDLYQKINQSNTNNFWKKIKLQQLQNTILSCAGIAVKASCDKPFGVIGQDYTFSVHIQNNAAPVTISRFIANDSIYTTDTTVDEKKGCLLRSNIHIPFTRDAYQPFWLNKTINGKHQMYTIDDSMTDKLIDTACCSVTIFITVNNLPLKIKTPVIYNTFDRMNGTITEPFYTIEPVQVSQKPVVLLTNVTGDTRENKSTDVTLKFTSYIDAAGIPAILKIKQPGLSATINGKTFQSSQPKELYHLDTVMSFKYGDGFSVKVPFKNEYIIKGQPASKLLQPSVVLNFPDGAQSFYSNIREVNYPYIPIAVYNYHNTTAVVDDTIKTKGKRVGYIFGLPDDNLSTALLQLGYKTDLLDIAGIQPDSLRNYDAIIIGNYLPIDRDDDSVNIINAKFYLGNYVYKGGTLISLTNNNEADNLLPYPVTAESGTFMYDAHQSRLALNDSSLFNYPNHIGIDSIAKWEGSLIDGYPAQYDTHYTPQLKIFSVKDNTYYAPVLSAQSGEGKVIYCNLNISSQAMDAQPDAFKLLANFIAIRYKNKHAN